MKTRKGRIGEPQEYVEFFEIDRLGKTTIVVQKSGDHWFIYKVDPGPKGAVQTLDNFTDREHAVDKATQIIEELGH